MFERLRFVGCMFAVGLIGLGGAAHAGSGSGVTGGVWTGSRSDGATYAGIGSGSTGRGWTGTLGLEAASVPAAKPGPVRLDVGLGGGRLGNGVINSAGNLVVGSRIGIASGMAGSEARGRGVDITGPARDTGHQPIGPAVRRLSEPAGLAEVT